MAWSTSNGNAYYVYAMGTNTVKPQTDNFNVALFTNAVTPVQSASVSVTQYGGAGSTWDTANEVSSTNYSAGGASVDPVSWTQANNVITFTSSGTPTWNTVSFTTYGCAPYASNHSNQLISWNYFGGAQTVSSGTFTITWNASGIVAFIC